MKVGYRIYPFWFGEGGEPTLPMKELAEGSAARMGRRVENIEITHRGFDNQRGGYMDFTVTYSSTAPIALKRTHE